MAGIEKIESFIQAEVTLNEVLDVSYSLAKRVVDIAEAKSTADEYMNHVGEILHEGHDFKSSALQAFGSDVTTPGVKVSRDAANVSFDIDENNAQRPVSDLEPVTGRYHSVAVRISELNESGKVRIEPIMVIASEYDGVDVTINGAPLVSYNRTDYSHVPLRRRANAELRVAGMEKIRQQSEAVNMLSRSGLRRTVYTKRLRALNEAFAREEASYIELTNVRTLHALGIHGKTHIDENATSTDYVLDSLITTIGKDRLLKFETELLYRLINGIPQAHEGTCAGRVVDVCADLSGVETNSLMVVLAAEGENYYIPLADVQKLWF